ncbi:uncharacterized protein N7515_005407 [Penicillium bovifimosum]|uniref:RED-like N-terminal domain-containing protein n=1 Tax=Penicillium bovifimosum TaxID=126998 RepID=A0A9W9GT42_9EURO|nr:uncharacterized protein N7515_005407 [Penicillium bovifimosum]KAJ5129368.1 hypothetical protein N7515_005407 [Penicillium bovifimosum]
MNNEQFRRLVADQSSSKPKGQSSTPAPDVSRGGATPGGSLGSRMRSSIPMTPRSVTGVDFARQLFEQRRQGDRPSKRFKSSAAPKGTALPTGYQDRAQLRNAEDDAKNGEDIEKRIKALEEMVKLGQIDQATFDKLRRDLGVGGDISSTHMVKGLDFDLLRRIRAGEDVSQAAEKPTSPPETEDAEEEFERLMEEKAQEEVVAVPKDQKEKKEKKKGTMAPPPMKPKTRDEILRELRASRAAAAAAPAPPPESILGSKFKKLSSAQPEKKRFVERDETGRRREVLLITDAQGNTKRKTRWLDKPVETPVPAAGDLPMPDKSAKPLGMDVPAELAARAAPAPEEEDDDIFAGVGDDYNPLAGLEEDDGSSSDEDGELAARKLEKAPVGEEETKPATIEPTPAKPRNYFATGTSDTAEAEPVDRSNPLTKDPTILAALKRAAALRQASPSAEGDERESSDAALRHKRFLEEARRREAMDAADMDMEFGGSRIEDGEEEDDGVLLDFDDDGRGGKKRKRGPKKKKGDKHSAADVLRVMEGRKKEAS